MRQSNENNPWNNAVPHYKTKPKKNKKSINPLCNLLKNHETLLPDLTFSEFLVINMVHDYKHSPYSTTKNLQFLDTFFKDPYMTIQFIDMIAINTNAFNIEQHQFMNVILDIIALLLPIRLDMLNGKLTTYRQCVQELKKAQIQRQTEIEIPNSLYSHVIEEVILNLLFEHFYKTFQTLADSNQKDD